MSLFDECFATIPDLSQKPADYEQFWQKALDNLKKIPQDVLVEKKSTKKILTENNFFLTFQSAGKVRLSAYFLAPRKILGKPPVVVVFPDYNKPIVAYKGLLQAGIAQFILVLRGQKEFELLKSKTNLPEEEKESEKKSPGYFGENLLSKENYYMTQLLLDAYRSLEVIRLRKEIDTGRIGIWGNGIGANMALFVSHFMQRTTALFLENPAFAQLELTQNLSEAAYALEINEKTRTLKKYKNIIKQNLAYCDAVYHTQDIEVPTTMAIDLQNKENVPHGAFAIFHLLKSEKEMHLFVGESSENQLSRERKTRQLAIRFFQNYLLGKTKQIPEENFKDDGTFAV